MIALYRVDKILVYGKQLVFRVIVLGLHIYYIYEVFNQAAL